MQQQSPEQQAQPSKFNQASSTKQIQPSKLNQKEDKVDKKIFQKSPGRPPSFPPGRGLRVIKRYGNRKLYDTERSAYVVLSDIARMIRNQENFRVVDNKTNSDITSSTLMQIIFGAERKTRARPSIDILKSIIKEGDGSFSAFLSGKLGALKSARGAGGFSHKPGGGGPSASSKNRKGKGQSIGAKVASMVIKGGGADDEESIPRLPGNGLRS